MPLIAIPAAAGAAVIITGGVLLASHGAGSTVGAGIQGAPVTIDRSLLAGQSANLPPVWMGNTGNVTETMVMRADNLWPHRRRILRASWVTGTGKAFTVDPGHGEYVTGLVVHVPAGTEPGTYRTALAASASAGTVIGRANFGAAAATGLRVVVAGESSIGTDRER